MLFIFALWSIMGLDTYCCLIFYGLTLIHLTGPLSQVVVQIICVINKYIKEKKGFSRRFCSLLLPPLAEREHALSFWTESGCRREELINP